MPKIAGDWDVENRMLRLGKAIESGFLLENDQPLPDVINITEAFRDDYFDKYVVPQLESLGYRWHTPIVGLSRKSSCPTHLRCVDDG